MAILAGIGGLLMRFQVRIGVRSIHTIILHAIGSHENFHRDLKAN